MSIFSNWMQSRAISAPVLRIPGGLPASIRSAKPFDDPYVLDTTKVDVELAKALYYNRDPRYKLGAGFARPAINVPVGFMGTPIFSTGAGNKTAQDDLDRLSETWSGDILRAHVALLRDGEILLRPRMANRSPAYAALFEGDEDWIEFGYNQAGSFDIETMDNDIGAVTGIKVTHHVVVQVPGQPRTETKKLYETVRPDSITIEWENNFKPKEVFGNPLGFVPAIHIQNGQEENQLHASSELEPVEPYLRFYNDVMLHAGSASKLHSTAKLVVRVKQLNTFLNNNFSDAEIKEGKLTFEDKDIMFFESGIPDLGSGGGGAAYAEGADIIQATAPLGDTNTLLEYIFLNIVDVTEVPEWAYGGAIASSKASVSEQAPPLIHKVGRKRAIVQNRWALAGRMALAMVGVKAPVSVSWDDLQQRDTKAESEAMKLVADAVISLNDAEIMSKYAAVEALRPFMPALLEYIVEEGDDKAATEKERLENEATDQEGQERALLERMLAAGAGVTEEEDEQDRQAGIAAVR